MSGREGGRGGGRPEQRKGEERGGQREWMMEGGRKEEEGMENERG